MAFLQDQTAEELEMALEAMNEAVAQVQDVAADDADPNRVKDVDTEGREESVTNDPLVSCSKDQPVTGDEQRRACEYMAQVMTQLIAEKRHCAVTSTSQPDHDHQQQRSVVHLVDSSGESNQEQAQVMSDIISASEREPSISTPEEVECSVAVKSTAPTADANHRADPVKTEKISGDGGHGISCTQSAIPPRLIPQNMPSLRLSLFVTVLGASYAAAVQVSVCRDATYEISADAAALCAGSGAAPAGWSCPKAGDVAVANCLSTLASFQSGSCVAPEDAVCQVVNGDTWGCVLPSVGCNDDVEEAKCETWDYSGDDSVDSSGSFDGNEDYDESWFMQTTKLREIYDCGHKPTPPPTTAAPESTPTATEAYTTEAPTATPVSTEDNGTEIDTGYTSTAVTLTPDATEEDDAVTEAPTPTPTSAPATTDGYTVPQTQTPTPTTTSAPETTDDDTLPPTETQTQTPAVPGWGGSSSAEDDDGQTTGTRGGNGETEVGDDEVLPGKSTTSVKFAATDAAGFGGLSDEFVAVIAAVAAFVAVVVAAVAVAFARKRRARDEVEDEKEEDEEDADSSEDEGEKSDADSADESEDVAMAVPPTPAVVTGKMATTPTAANTKAKEATPKPKPTSATAAATAAETSASSKCSGSEDAEIAGDEKAGEETADSPKDAVAVDDD
ncbi:hypothetical protein PR002_g6312 [Phytophthora rubi]|nr:hypothetical protein PR002_g6312 [Phytophthora rubi]